MFTTMESLLIIFSHQGSHWGTAHLLLKIARDIKEAFNESKIWLQLKIFLEPVWVLGKIHKLGVYATYSARILGLLG